MNMAPNAKKINLRDKLEMGLCPKQNYQQKTKRQKVLIGYINGLKEVEVLRNEQIDNFSLFFGFILGIFFTGTFISIIDNMGFLR